MFKTYLAAGLLACAAFVSMAQAQGNPPAENRAGGKFVQSLQANQFRGSDLMGQYVYNPQDESIGSIGDIILDGGGKVSAVVIDVGGFLGIGANEVAVRYDALRFEAEKERVATAAETGAPDAAGRSSASSAPSDPAAGSGTADMAGRPGADTAVGGGAGASNQSIAKAQTISSSTLNTRIVLDASRDDLTNAPKLDDTAARDAKGDAK